MNISLLRTRPKDFTSAGIRQIIHNQDGEPESVPLVQAARPSAPNIILAAIHSLTVENFTLPFSSKAKIASTLRTRTLPYQMAGSLELFTSIISTHAKSTSGLAWYCSRSELETHTSLTAGPSSVTWPAPLPLVSQLPGGTGVTLWTDGYCTASMLWQSYAPVLYRWSRHTPAQELSWYEHYCKSTGNTEQDSLPSFVLDARETDGQALRTIVQASAAQCEWISGVNLSITALEDVHALEGVVKKLTVCCVSAAVCGGILLGAGMLRLMQERSIAESFRARSEAVYREVFEPARTGRISNPVMLARDRIASLTERGASGRTFAQVVGDLGRIWSEGTSLDVRLDIIRYNSEGLDCTGTAHDMGSVLAFRKAWEERGVTATVDNTQSVSGIGYRFDMRVRWK